MTDVHNEQSGMKSPPAFQFYPGDFIGDGNVAAMTNRELGCYMKLLCSQWREGTVPGDTKRLAVICGESPRDMAKLWPAIAPCFRDAGDGRLQNGRMERERAIQTAFREKQRQSGLASGRARATTAPTRLEPDANGGSTTVPTRPEPKGNSSSSSSSSERPSDVKGLAPDGAGAPGESPGGEHPEATSKPTRKPGTGPHAEFLAWFVSQYQLALGSPYPVTAKDGVTVARLLKTFAPDDLRARASRLLTTDDPWLAGTDRGLGVLSSQINKPILRGLVPAGASKRSNVDDTIAAAKRVAERMGIEP